VTAPGTAAPGPRGVPRRFDLVLPSPAEDAVPGGRFVRRAVWWTLLLLLAIAVAAGITLSVLEVEVTVSGRGVLEPGLVLPVRTREAGIVTAVFVTTGDTVLPGTPLAQLDQFEDRQALGALQARRRQLVIDDEKALAALPIELRRQQDRIAAAEAARIRSRAQLRAQLVDLGMAPDASAFLADYRPGASVTLDLAVANVQIAEAEYRGARGAEDALRLAELDHRRLRAELALLDQQVAAARERITRLTIVAPSGGVVLTEDLHRMVGLRLAPGDVLLEQSDTSAWRVTLRVSEADVHRVAVGDSVRVAIQAFRRDADRRVDGSVVDIAPQPAPDVPGAYRVVVSLVPEQLLHVGVNRLRRGYSVEGKIVTRSGNAFRLLWGYLRETIG